ncbi:MAG: CAP domain-containing protein [Cyanobacteria bacterium J06560_2]
MKWTALWSLVMTSVMITSCGSGGSDGQEATSNDSGPNVAPISAATGGNCTPLEGYFSELLNRTNEARAKVNAAPLRFSLQLGKSAQDYAEKMATQNFFGHGAKDSFVSRIRATGYTGTYVGENLVAGRYTPGGAFTNWLESDSHYKNLINPTYTEVGFGMFDTTGESTYGRYWAQHLGSGNSQGGTYVPSNCGLTTVALEDIAPKSAVAGRSNISEKGSVDVVRSLPKQIHTSGNFNLPGNGTIPVGSLAFAVAGKNNGTGNQEIPEPALLLGIAGLGVAIVRDRKVAAKKRAAQTDN